MNRLKKRNNTILTLPSKIFSGGLFLLLALLPLQAMALQFSVYEGKSLAEDNDIRLYKYYLKYLDKKDHAAPVIATSDKGILLVGDINSDNLTKYKYYTKLAFILKFAENGELAWSLKLKPKGGDLQSMAVIEDFQGSYLVFMLEHRTLGSPGQMRVVRLKEGGEILWDIMLGKTGRTQRPHASRVIRKKDGKIFLLTGHIYPNKAALDQENAYVWEAELDTNGKITRETIGDIFK